MISKLQSPHNDEALSGGTHRGGGSEAVGRGPGSGMLRFDASAVTVATAYRPIVAFLFAFAILCNITEMSDGTSGGRVTSGALSLPLLVRLAAAASVCLVGGLAFLYDARVRSVLKTLPGLLFTLIGCGFIASSVFAISDVSTISWAASLIFVGYLVFTASVVAQLRFETIIELAVAALAAFLCVTWALYLFVPSVGVFYEFTSMTSTVPRMGGTAHPNGVGRDAALALLLSVALIRSSVWPGPAPAHEPLADSRRSSAAVKTGSRLRLGLLVVVCLMAVGALIESKSRTAMISLFISAIALMADRLRSRRIVAGILVTMMFGCAILLALEIVSGGEFVSERFLAAITKTGNAEELTSATGRTEIWSAVIDLIGQRPLLGWGLDSAASLGIEAGSTHNLIFNVVLSSGLITGLVAVGTLAWTGFVGLRSSRPAVRAICAYVLMSGLVEDTVFESFPSSLTLLWIVALLTTCMRTGDQGSVDQRSSPGRAGR